MARSVRVLLGLLAFAASGAAWSSPTAAAALLEGSVSGPSGPLEGVLVKATEAGSGMAVSVFSQADGRYGFPDKALKPGSYRIDIRATGYDLAAPATAALAEGKTTTLPIRLKTVDPSAQWTNAELISALPLSGGPVEERFVLNMCTHCHGVDRVLSSTHDRNGLIDTIARMGVYAANSVPDRPVLRPDAAERMGTAPSSTPMSHDELALAFAGTGLDTFATYIAKVNLSAGRKSAPYKTKAFPRPTGDATKVVIRSWSLPRKETMPHDVIVDAKGIVWYDDFAAQVLGRLDPATGATKEYELPTLRPDAPKGALEIRFAPDGAIWIGLMYQGGIARFDPKTEKFKIWPLPKADNPGIAQVGMTVTAHSAVDGKVWMVDAAINAVRRLDLKTGAFETFKPLDHLPPPKGTGFVHTVYGIASDAQNNLYFSDWGESQIGRIDAKTGAVTFYQTPHAPTRPRRMHMDEQGRLWYAGWQANTIGYLDTKTGRVQDWTLPTPNSAPYDVMSDAFGNVWAVGMASDRVQRVSIATGTVTDYLLPEHNVNGRRAFVQNTKSGPVFWVGNELGASILAVQPLD